MSGQILSLHPILAAAGAPPRGRLGRAAGFLLRPRDPAVATGPGATGPGDAARFRQVMLPHLDSAYSFARFLCHDASVAEDLVQDAYLRAFRGFSGYRGGDAKAWLFAIVRSSFLTWLRSQRAWSEVTTPEAVDLAKLDARTPDDTPEEARCGPPM
jgi:DNA-directed RNA polymerase specialized sigma24 family protein